MTTRKTRKDSKKHLGCEVAGCTAGHYSKGYCKNHWSNWNRTGTPLGSRSLPKAPKEPCIIDGCEKLRIGKSDWCSGHWQRNWMWGDVKAHIPLQPYKPEGIAGYNASHRKIYKERGAAREHQCIVCNEQARHWALRADATIVTDTFSYETGKKYSIDPWDYDPMCISHHFRYDRAHAGITSTRGVKK